MANAGLPAKLSKIICNLVVIKNIEKLSMRDFFVHDQKIIDCRRCPRLIHYIREVAEKKVRRFREEDYWGKPVPGMGDPEARVFILGLAPAAHGANRTGRMFTGDASGDWLTRALYETGYANQPTSVRIGDGLQLKDVYIASTVRCAPPQNKPLKEEIFNCRPYFQKEIEMLPNLKVVITLGQIAFKNFLDARGEKGPVFGHLRQYRLSDGTILISSFHPSKQNTQTGKLSWKDWVSVFEMSKSLSNQ